MNKFNTFINLVRLDNWRSDKISFLFLILLYFQLTSGILGWGFTFYKNFMLATVYGFSYYCFLFLINDIFDLKQDKLAGKSKSVTSSLKAGSMLLLNLLFVLIGTVCLFMLWNKLSLFLIGVILLGFLIAYFYSAPPFRFKEKGIWGIVVGSLTLRPLPLMILFSGVDLREYFFDLIILLVWIELYSINRIFWHQIEDYENDIRAKVKTFILSIGRTRAMNTKNMLLFPLEVMSFFTVLVLIIFRINSIFYLFLSYTIFLGAFYLLRRTQLTNYYAQHKPFLFDFYLLLLPLFFSLLLLKTDSLWIMPLFILWWGKKWVMQFLNLIKS